MLWWALTKVETLLMRTAPGRALRSMACALAMKHVHYEDENTRYIDIGPVNKVMNMLCCWFEDPEGRNGCYQKHLPRIADYLWLAEDGMKMQGYNGSQLWDCAFAVQAISATGLAPEYRECLRAANRHSRFAGAGRLSELPLHRTGTDTSARARGRSAPATTVGQSRTVRPRGSRLRSSWNTWGRIWLVRPCPSIASRTPSTSSYRIRTRAAADGPHRENTRSHRWVADHQPGGDVRRHHDRLPVRGVQLRVAAALTKFARRYPKRRAAEISRAVKRAQFLLSIQKPDGS